MPDLTFVTTCRNRLDHLQQTLPTWVAQQDAEWVVVDYDCPQHCGDWVELHFPQAKVVRATNRPRFEAAKARNLGARHVQTPWICFIDADVRLAPNFLEQVRKLLVPQHYYQAEPRTNETWGTTICQRKDFAAIGGYDEVMQGWGKEDEDFYARLVLAGARYAAYPGNLLSAIAHDDETRVENHDLKDRWLSESINHVYLRAKIDLMLLRRQPIPLEMRQRLYDQVRTSVLGARESGQALQITVPFLEQQTRLCGPLQSRLVYALPQPRGEGRPRAMCDNVIPRPLPG